MHAHPIRDKIEETINNLQQVLRDSALISAIGQAAGLIGLAMKSGNKLMICGNGGSAAEGDVDARSENAAGGGQVGVRAPG